MSKQRFMLSVLLVVALLAPGMILAQPAGTQSATVPAASTGSTLFVENAGQWPDAARFQVWGSPAGIGTTWLAEDAIWITIVDTPLPSPLHSSPLSFEERGEGPGERREVRALNLKLTFPGANPNVQIQPFEPLTTTVSYILGNDRAQWHPAVPVYGGVRYADLYPGVDLVLGQADGFWQLQAEPGATTEQVEIQVDGAAVVAVTDGVLRLAMAGEPLSLALPRASFDYQVTGASQRGTGLTQEVRSSVVRSRQPNQPEDNFGDLVYSTYLGGRSNDYAYAIVLDDAGQATVAGATQSSIFPITPGAFDLDCTGGASNCYDGFIARLAPDGSSMIYSTFLGGDGWDEIRAAGENNDGRAIVAGFTYSSDFPTTYNALDASYNDNGDGFVAILSADGRSLAYGTYLG